MTKDEKYEVFIEKPEVVVLTSGMSNIFWKSKRPNYTMQVLFQ